MIKGCKQRALYIGGEWVSANDFETVINPADEEVIGEAPVGGDEHVEAALAAAREAFDNGPWRRMQQKQRQEKLHEFLDVLMQRAGEIVPLIVAESGSTQMIDATCSLSYRSS